MYIYFCKSVKDYLISLFNCFYFNHKVTAKIREKKLETTEECNHSKISAFPALNQHMSAVVMKMNEARKNPSCIPGIGVLLNEISIVSASSEQKERMNEVGSTCTSSEQKERMNEIGNARTSGEQKERKWKSE